MTKGKVKSPKINFLVVATLLVSNFAFAQTWTQTSAPITNWTSIACSADGSKLIAAADGGVGPGYVVAPGSIFISTNSGVAWIQATNAPAAEWTSVASSADGNQLTAAVSGGRIWRSVDSGFTWNQTSALSNYWVSVASSADGKKLNALARSFPSNDFFTSSDSGNTWTTNASPYDRWSVMVSSADGNKLLACGALGTILTSTNSGKTWITNVFSSGSVSGIAVSTDGSRFLLVGSKIYISTNSGIAWTQTGNFSAGRIAASADGHKLVALGSGVFISTNSGFTWTTNSSPANWSSIVSSADGNTLAAAVNGGGIWTLQTTPTPQLNLSTVDTNLALSWTIPSTNFVLQQSTDLISWADMTDAPALNLTNLQNQVTLTPSNSAAFYRLKTP